MSYLFCIPYNINTAIMGCVRSLLTCRSGLNCCKTSPPSPEEVSSLTIEAEPPKKYSWDTRPKILNYKIEKEFGQEILREPGSINGQQIIVENCKGCKIYLLDHSAALNIDDCDDCVIICGPVKGSIFLRDTTNTTLCSASGQLRLRDAKNIHLFVGSEAEPIIEASIGIHIGPYALSYEGIEDHFSAALLSREKLVTNSIYDFTPPQGPTLPNWTQIPSSVQRSRFLPSPTSASGFGFSIVEES